jgi:hypothetical protein
LLIQDNNNNIERRDIRECTASANGSIQSILKRILQSIPTSEELMVASIEMQSGGSTLAHATVTSNCVEGHHAITSSKGTVSAPMLATKPSIEVVQIRNP